MAKSKIPPKNGYIIIAGESINNPIWDEKELLYAGELWRKGYNIRAIARVFNRANEEVLLGLLELKKQQRLNNFIHLGALKRKR